MPSCFRQNFEDPTQPVYSGCTPEEHRARIKVPLNVYSWNNLTCSHLSKTKVEGLEVEDDGRRVVPRQKHRIFFFAFQKTPGEIGKSDYQYASLPLHWVQSLNSTGTLPLVSNDWVNLAAGPQLSCGGCDTFLHEQQQWLMRLLLHCCPYWHGGAQRNDVRLCYAW